MINLMDVPIGIWEFNGLSHQWLCIFKEVRAYSKVELIMGASQTSLMGFGEKELFRRNKECLPITLK